MKKSHFTLHFDEKVTLYHDWAGIWEGQGLSNIENALSPGCELELDVEYPDKSFSKINVLCRIDTKSELEYYRNGGILHYVLRNLINN